MRAGSPSNAPDARRRWQQKSALANDIFMDANHSASRALPPSLPPPPIYRPPAMTRFFSLVAIAAVATVTSDALVPGADAARLGTLDVDC